MVDIKQLVGKEISVNIAIEGRGDSFVGVRPTSVRPRERLEV